VFGSILGTGIFARVKAFTGSERFKENDAFSAQIAHWSLERDQYFPCWVSTLCSLFAPEVPRIDCAMEEMLEDTLIRDVKRERCRRTDRVPIRGSRKRRNSWQQDLISDWELRWPNNLQ
jgi:hypothetical protein